MSPNSELKLIKRDLKTLLRAGFSINGTERLYANIITFCDPECITMIDTTLYTFNQAFTVQYSYYENHSSMTIFFGKRNIECTLLDFQNDGTIVIGKASSDKDLEIYDKGIYPTDEDLKFINIDHETFMDFYVLKSVLEPIVESVYIKYFKNLGQN